MSTRAAILALVRDNLDDLDSANYRWQDARLQAILDRSRRYVYRRVRSLKPGRYFRTSETITLVAGTSEYTLATANVDAILGIERIARNGTALARPEDINPIDFSERNQYNYNNTSIVPGAEYYYVVPQESGAMIVGFMPQVATSGADMRAYLSIGPHLSWAAGAGQDSNDSGFRPDIEDYLVLVATVAALRQRPSVEPATIQGWAKEADDFFQTLKNAEDDLKLDQPQQVIYNDEIW